MGLFSKFKAPKLLKYWTMEHLVNLPEWLLTTIIFLFSVRDTGKSFAVREYVIKDYLKRINEKRKRFIYLRRYDIEVDAGAVERYFADIINLKEDQERNWLEIFSDGKWNNVRVRNHEIQFVYEKIVEKKNKRTGDITKELKLTNRETVGYYFCLNTDAKYIKSQGFDDVQNIIFEEAVPVDGRFLNSREPEMLLDLISTVFRRERGKVFCIFNQTLRDNIYANYFGMDMTANNFEPGDIHKYKFITEKGEEIYSILEWCNLEDNAHTSSMVGNSVGSKINDNVFLTKQQNTITQEELSKYGEPIYTVIICKNEKFRYICDMYLDEDNANTFIYIYPKKIGTTIKPGDRVITKELSLNPLYTQRLEPLLNSKIDIAFMQTLDANRVYFCNNLIGSEFWIAYDELRQDNRARI